MTIFAGAASLNPQCPLPGDLLDALRRAVSRSEKDVPVEAGTGGFFVAKVDIGAFGVPALECDAQGNVMAVAGEPLLSDGEGDLSWDRSRDVALLNDALARDDLAILGRTRGTFCAVHYHHATGAVTLFVDKAGVRPVYLWVGPQYVVFSTALRVLESIDAIPKRFDVRGVTELAAFSYALSDRTAYEGIKTLKAGELARIAGGAVERRPYWRWDGDIDRASAYAGSVQRTYSEFVDAISRRQRKSTFGAAFLSGGLDSRAIVGGLRATGNEVFTVNYAPDGSQDQVYAALVSEQMGNKHTQIETNAGNVVQGYRKTAVANWIAQTFPGERAPMIWSGDGGSVALGNVYLTDAIVDAMNAGQVEQAIAAFTQGIPQRIIKPGMREAVARMPFDGVKEELDAIACDDPGRRFHLFLMFNDQRRHLVQHFEDIDLERIEFQLPFFDADFLASILRMPNDPFNFHRFYMDWLDKFPNRLASVPWQAYPGHVPCTLPSPPGLKYQWEQYYDKAMYTQMKQATVQLGRRILADRHFPAHLVDGTALRLAILLTRLGVRDYGYLIKTAATYHRYWAATRATAPAA